jgi:hypothetical protein
MVQIACNVERLLGNRSQRAIYDLLQRSCIESNAKLRMQTAVSLYEGLVMHSYTAAFAMTEPIKISGSHHAYYQLTTTAFGLADRADTPPQTHNVSFAT